MVDFLKVKVEEWILIKCQKLKKPKKIQKRVKKKAKQTKKVIQSKLYEFIQNKGEINHLIVSSNKEAILARDVFEFLDIKTFVLPHINIPYGDDLKPFREEIFEINHILKTYYAYNKNKVLILTLATSLLHFPKANLLQDMTLNFGDTIKLKDFKDMLYRWGYMFSDMLELEGEVSIRGDIIDIYPPTLENPYRISLFGDEIESIRAYNISTGKSNIEEIESIIITPAFFSFSENEYEKINEQIENYEGNILEKDIESVGYWLIDNSQFFIDDKTFFIHQNISLELEDLFLDKREKSIGEYLKVPSIKPAKNFKDIYCPHDLSEFAKINSSKKIQFLNMNENFLTHLGIVESNIELVKNFHCINIQSNDLIIISLNKEVVRKKKKKAISLDEFKINDYIVHEKYGIGQFIGIENISILGTKKDVVIIHYQNHDRLMIPIENLDILERYLADTGSLPSLDKLGKSSFVKLKEKTRVKIFEIANKIIEMAASREIANAKKLDISSSDLSHFQNLAGFEYTSCQKEVVSHIKNDFSNDKVMDRLLVGDVGFGKTEVALNAIYMMAKKNYQSLFLAPTTLLSSQHFKSLQERFGNTDIITAHIDRTVKAKDKKIILERFAKGEISVIVGTHGLLNVGAHNLGLFIIDEEHKFGVKQKEKIKEISKNTHILSMSATPIPRSLNLALSKIKQIDYLRSAPMDRKDIRTYVKEYDESMLKTAILRELKRGGQLFYVHNRIDSLPIKKQDLLSILPNLRILVLHSQIPASVSEKEMIKFSNKEYDILLATSIIESGIHMPNVNTIMIDNSNNFGIADLHQLRGRVGRSKREGFCYFLIEDTEKITDDAKKRLLSLERNSALGSGSILAHKDLEIRGSGNILGVKQSGYIKGIGYNLYIKMLEEAISEQSQNVKMQEQEVQINLSINKFISSELVSDDRLRLDLYRRLSKCRTPMEVIDIEEEIIDRFGKLDENTKIFINIILIKIYSIAKKIKSIYNMKKIIRIEFYNQDIKEITSTSEEHIEITYSILEFLRNKD